MKQALLAAAAAAILLAPGPPAGAVSTPAFSKISGHFYCLESAAGSPNTGAVITPEGILLIDPPPEEEIPGLLNALKAITPRPVRWLAATDYRGARTGGATPFLKQGAALICSREMDRLAAAVPAPDAGLTPAYADPRFVFNGQMRLFPAGLEIRIIAIRPKARTAGDVIVFVPKDRVLMVGELFDPANYPSIDDSPGDGSASGWVDGLKQAIDSVPLLKSAMPQPKPDPTFPPEPELKLEESITVIPAHGAPTNLQAMKDLLGVVLKLRSEANRAVAAGRSRESFIGSLAAETYGAYGNLDVFAGRLFDELARK